MMTLPLLRLSSARGLSIQLRLHAILLNRLACSRCVLELPSQEASAQRRLPHEVLILFGHLALFQSFSNPSAIKLLGSRIFCLMSSTGEIRSDVVNSGPRFFPPSPFSCGSCNILAAATALLPAS